MLKRIFSILLVLVVFSSLFVGCNKKDNSDGDPSSTKSSETKEESKEESKETKDPVRISWIDYAGIDLEN